MSSIQYMEEYFKSDINIENLKTFLFGFKDGNIEIIKWLLFYDYKLNLTICNDLPLCIAIEHNQLNILKWMNKLTTNIDYERHCEHIITFCVEEGYIDVLKWIYNINPELIFKMNITDIFRLSINLNNLDIAKWLIEISKDNNIKIKFIPENDEKFIEACQENNIKLAQILVDVRPKGYYINVIDDQIMVYEIISSLIIDNVIESESNNEICPICYVNISNVITSCNHLFCFNCLERHYCVNNQNCPCCRKKNEEDELVLIM